jgi:hypothetical protein
MSDYRYICVRGEKVQPSIDGTVWAQIPDITATPDPVVPESPPIIPRLASPTTVEAIREHLADIRARLQAHQAGSQAEAFMSGRVAGLEFALRALGVEP